jgi:hypothetical protein
MTNLDTLRGSLGKLGPRDRAFAESLLSSASTRGLTDKQRPWVDKLVRRATTPPVEIGKIDGLADFMAQAGARAKIVLQVTPAEGDPLAIRLAIAGARSSEPGSITVTSTDRGFDARRFYGRVSRDGTFRPGRDAEPATETAIVAALGALARDPAGTAAAYGQLTGECCFCAIALTTKESVAVGYGPICAKRYGLPWGARR